MCDKHARCGHCIHETCSCGSFAGTTKFVDPVSGRYVRDPATWRVLKKKTGYPNSISLTETEYRKALAGEYDEVVIFWTKTGGVLTAFSGEALQELTKRARPHLVDKYSCRTYWVVRF